MHNTRGDRFKLTRTFEVDEKNKKKNRKINGDPGRPSHGHLIKRRPDVKSQTRDDYLSIKCFEFFIFRHADRAPSAFAAAFVNKPNRKSGLTYGFFQIR